MTRERVDWSAENPVISTLSPVSPVLSPATFQNSSTKTTLSPVSPVSPVEIVSVRTSAYARTCAHTWTVKSAGDTGDTGDSVDNADVSDVATGDSAGAGLVTAGEPVVRADETMPAIGSGRKDVLAKWGHLCERAVSPATAPPHSGTVPRAAIVCGPGGARFAASNPARSLELTGCLHGAWPVNAAEFHSFCEQSRGPRP